MAARTRRIRHDEETRAKIQASQLINRLTNHALGEIDMSATQVRAAEILLSKSLPNLQTVEVDLDAEVGLRKVEIEHVRSNHSEG